MNKWLVCKTVVPYPAETKYLLFFAVEGWTVFPRLDDLAAYLIGNRGLSEQLFIKNDVPVDIIWTHYDMEPSRIIECERLSKGEVRELTRLLAT